MADTLIGVQDLMRKEYMGEVMIPLLDWFEGGNVKLWHDNLPVSSILYILRPV